jgi:hypothetical protein
MKFHILPMYSVFVGDLVILDVVYIIDPLPLEKLEESLEKQKVNYEERLT